MVSPGCASARTARRDPVPLSWVFKTVRVLGSVRSSNSSRCSLQVARHLHGTTLHVRPARVRAGPNFRKSSIESYHMITVSFLKAVCDIMVTATYPGAQTERRGGAGPVRDLLGGKASSADFLPILL